MALAKPRGRLRALRDAIAIIVTKDDFSAGRYHWTGGRMDADRIMKLGRRHDCEMELFHTLERSTVFSAEKGEVHSKDANFTEGFAVRTIKSKRLGFYPFENEAELETSVEKSLKLGKVQERGNYFFSKLNGTSKKYFDPKCGMFEEWGIEALEGMTETHERLGVRGVQDVLGTTMAEDELITSEGNAVKTISSNFFAVSQVTYKETEADDSYSSAKFSFSPAEIARNAAEFAKASANAQEIEGGKMPVIFDIRALHQLIQLFLPFNFNGESHRKKLSKLEIGNGFCPGNITICDDSSMTEGSKPAEFDDEGFGSKKTKLIDKGTAKQFIYNMQTAAKMKKANVGNGYRVSFSAPPVISFADLAIEGGNVNDLMKECKHGVYVNSFLTSGANPVTGDFSFPLLVAFKVKDGEPVNSIRGAMMKGNFFELMKHARFERETAIYNGLKSGRMECELEIIS